MNALTKAAKYSHKKEVFTNYTIAVVAGIVLGVMFALFI